MTAGFSLGELAALAYAGAGSFAEIFQLVTKRGALMQQAAEEQPTAMVAALKLSAEDVEALRRVRERLSRQFQLPGPGFLLRSR